jgi:putative hydrolase of the HAD superfamily
VNGVVFFDLDDTLIDHGAAMRVGAARLHGTWRLGVITNGRSSEQRCKLDRIGLAGRFETIIISEECGHAKPDPAIFLSACRQAGVEPAQSWYIGDQYELDALAARRAGLIGVWLNRTGAHPGGEGILTLDSLRGLRGLLHGDVRP